MARAVRLVSTDAVVLVQQHETGGHAVQGFGERVGFVQSGVNRIGAPEVRRQGVE